MMSEFDIEELVGILRENCPEYEEGHHMGRPYMSAYQIAVHFCRRNPEHHLPIGGTGVGSNQSLAQRIARFLSMTIRNDEYPALEGSFISHSQLKSMTFTDFENNLINVSTLGSKAGHSIFRVRH
jgi:hypothetical protein